MDKDYVDNIVGSPFVNEKGFRHLKKKTLQSEAARTVYEAPTPPQKSQSLWGKVMNALNSPKPVATPSPTGNATPPNSDESSKNDLATIVDRTIDIIIDTVKSDISRAAPFIGPEQKPMPTAYGGPVITKEVEAPPSIEPKSSPKKKAEDYYDEVEGEFLYNFSSKYNKFPGSPFSIEMKPRTISNVVDLPGSGKKKKLTVLWRNSSHMNEIIVTATPAEGTDDEANTTTVLFKFYDDQVNPKTSAGKITNLNLLLSQAHPMTPNSLEGADPAIMERIKSKWDNLSRSLYATVYRKSMEFSPKKKGLITLVLTNEKTGTVRDRNNKVYNQEQIKAYLNSADPKEAKQWKDSLEEIDYFVMFPDMRPMAPEDYPIFKDVMAFLVTDKYGKDVAYDLTLRGWTDLRLTQKMKAEDITFQDLYKATTKAKATAMVKMTTPDATAPPPPPPEAKPEVKPEVKPEIPPAPVVKPAKKKHEIKVWKDNKGNLMWSNLKGEEAPLSPKQARLYGHHPAFAAAFNAAKKNKFVKPKGIYEFEEEGVNPFQRDNFLT